MELINMQPVNNDTGSLRKLYDDLEKHMRSLKALHQDINQDVCVTQGNSVTAGDTERK